MCIEIFHHLPDHWAPIDYQWFTAFHIELVGIVNIMFNRKLQFHSGLPFKTDLLTEADE